MDTKQKASRGAVTPGAGNTGVKASIKATGLLACICFTQLAVASECCFIHTYSDAKSLGDNTFVGLNSGNRYMSRSGGPNFWASGNTVAGNNTLSFNLTGWENTALGTNGLYSNLEGYHNTALGYVSLSWNDHGANNTAVGHSAMYQNRSGTHNTAVGMHALYFNSTGKHNVGVGWAASFANTSGNWNTAVGVGALFGTQAGVGNTALGAESGTTDDFENRNVSGSRNTWIGYQSGPGSPDQYDGTLAIGHAARIYKDHQAVFGSPAIVETLLYGNVGVGASDPAATLVVDGEAVNQTGVWEVYSDRRLKKVIGPYTDGLGTVVQLEPVTFKYNGREGLSDDKSHVGLAAQAVRKVAPYMVSRQAGKDLEEVLVMSNQALPYMLVNAIQELHARMAAIEARLQPEPAGGSQAR